MRVPRVSVVVPSYNHARFLPKRLDSILAQTYQDTEIIVLDDASQDGSQAIIEGYANDPRLRIEFNAVNSGSPFKQWNKGVSLARGEFVWIAESDDYALPTLLEQLVAALDREPKASLVYCRSRQVDEADRFLGFAPDSLQQPEAWARDFVCAGSEFIADRLVDGNGIPNASAVLINRGLYRAVGGADPRFKLAGDWKLWISLACLGKVAYLSEPMNFFRCHSSSVRETTSRKPAQSVEILRCMDLAHRASARRTKLNSAVLAAVRSHALACYQTREAKINREALRLAHRLDKDIYKLDLVFRLRSVGLQCLSWLGVQIREVNGIATRGGWDLIILRRLWRFARRRLLQ